MEPATTTCPNGHSESPYNEFCRTCGENLPIRGCLEGHPLGPSDVYCGRCGSKAAVDPAASPSESAGTVDRKYCHRGHVTEGGAARCSCGSNVFTLDDPLAVPASPPHGERRSVLSKQPEPPMLPPTNAFAILSLVFAILIWPVGLAFALVARRQLRETREQGESLAYAGLVISCIEGAANVLVLVIAISVALH